MSDKELAREKPTFVATYQFVGGGTAKRIVEASFQTDAQEIIERDLRPSQPGMLFDAASTTPPTAFSFQDADTGASVIVSPLAVAFVRVAPKVEPVQKESEGGYIATFRLSNSDDVQMPIEKAMDQRQAIIIATDMLRTWDGDLVTIENTAGRFVAFSRSNVLTVSADPA